MGVNRFMLLLATLCLSVYGLQASPAGHQEKTFVAMVGFHCDLKNAAVNPDTIDLANIYNTLVNKVNELSKNKKFSISFHDDSRETVETPGKTNLFLNINIQFNTDPAKNGVDVFYSDDNDYTFQSIKYANIVVSEVKSSKLNLKVHGMIESDMTKLKSATGPALEVIMNLAGTREGAQVITDENKLDALAKMIFECVERISKS